MRKVTRKVMRKRQAIWPVLAFFALYSTMMTIEWRKIERDVAQRAGEVLAARSLPWATAVTHNRGRDVLLIGEAPTEVDLRLAQLFIADVDGVRTVHHR